MRAAGRGSQKAAAVSLPLSLINHLVPSPRARPHSSTQATHPSTHPPSTTTITIIHAILVLHPPTPTPTPTPTPSVGIRPLTNQQAQADSSPSPIWCKPRTRRPGPGCRPPSPSRLLTACLPGLPGRPGISLRPLALWDVSVCTCRRPSACLGCLPRRRRPPGRLLRATPAAPPARTSLPQTPHHSSCAPPSKTSLLLLRLPRSPGLVSTQRAALVHTLTGIVPPGPLLSVVVATDYTSYTSLGPRSPSSACAAIPHRASVSLQGCQQSRASGRASHLVSDTRAVTNAAH